jgi:hypothetical protein
VLSFALNVLFKPTTVSFAQRRKRMAKSQAARAGSKAKKELDKAAETKADESTEGRVFPKSEANTAGSHEKSAAEIAAQVSPAKGESGAQANARSMDAASEQLDKAEAKSAEDEDKSIFGRIARSGLVINLHHASGDEWVGPSVQNEGPEFNHMKTKTSVGSLTVVAPRSGMIVRPDGLKGDSFTIPEGFNVDSKPDDWAKVFKPDGSSLFG